MEDVKIIDPKVKALQKQTRKAPGNIRAKNKETGVIFYIRPDMLKIEGHPWIILDASEQNAIQASKPDGTPDVILTKEGKPFKSESAAKTAMKTKELSDMEWVIIPVDDGFIISKV
jgi:hypothetical protein